MVSATKGKSHNRLQAVFRWHLSPRRKKKIMRMQNVPSNHNMTGRSANYKDSVAAEVPIISPQSDPKCYSKTALPSLHSVRLRSLNPSAPPASFRARRPSLASHVP